MNKSKIVILSAAAMICFTTNAFAEEAGARGRGSFAESGKRHRFKKHRRGGLLRIDPAKLKAKLGLTDGQVQQMRAITDAVRSRTKAQRDQIRPLRRQLRALMWADVIDANAINTVREQLKAVRLLLKDERFKAKLQVMQVLSKDQRDKMQRMHRERMQRWQGKAYRGRGMRVGEPQQ